MLSTGGSEKEQSKVLCFWVGQDWTGGQDTHTHTLALYWHYKSDKRSLTSTRSHLTRAWADTFISLINFPYNGLECLLLKSRNLAGNLNNWQASIKINILTAWSWLARVKTLNGAWLSLSEQPSKDLNVWMNHALSMLNVLFSSETVYNLFF